MIVAGFAGREGLRSAWAALRAEQLEVESYTPAPAEDAGPEGSASPLPLLILLAFLAGAGGMFGLQVYANTAGYPINVGGRPDNSWPAFIVNAFEAGVLGAMLTGVIGFFGLNRMPHLYEPVDQAHAARGASRDLWLVGVTGDPGRVRAVLARCGAVSIEQVRE